MKKILHLINNNDDGIYHFVKKLVSTDLIRYDNLILSKYSSSEDVIKLDIMLFQIGFPFFVNTRNRDKVDIR